MLKEMMQKLQEASIKAIRASESPESLEAMRVKYLGKKGELTAILRQMGQLSAEERPAMGQMANRLREEIEQAIVDMAKSYNMEPDQIRQFVNVDVVRTDLARRKAAQVIRDNAVKKAPAAPAAEEKPAE